MLLLFIPLMIIGLAALLSLSAGSIPVKVKNKDGNTKKMRFDDYREEYICRNAYDAATNCNPKNRWE